MQKQQTPTKNIVKANIEAITKKQQELRSLAQNIAKNNKANTHRKTSSNNNYSSILIQNVNTSMNQAYNVPKVDSKIKSSLLRPVLASK